MDEGAPRVLWPLFHRRNDIADKVTIEGGRRVDYDVVVLAQRPHQLSVGKRTMHDIVCPCRREIVVDSIAAYKDGQRPLGMGFLEVDGQPSFMERSDSFVQCIFLAAHTSNQACGTEQED